MENHALRTSSRALAALLWSVLAACQGDSESPPRGERELGAEPPARLPSGSSVAMPPASAGAAVCAAISQQAEPRHVPADVIIAVDNSGSMREEIGFIREQLNAFSRRIAESGVDLRIILISAPQAPDANAGSDEADQEANGLCIAAPLGSGNCPLDSRPERYLHVSRAVGSHDALDMIIETFPSWRAQLRAESNKLFLVVTDDDSRTAADRFRQRVDSLPGNLFRYWSFSGIYCRSACREAAAVGRVYQQLVDLTHGIAGDLCLQDFQPVFEALAHAVVESSRLACAWSIPTPPSGLAFEREQVNVQYTALGTGPSPLFQVPQPGLCGSSGGWYFDDPSTPAQIVLCPTTCALLQSDERAAVDVLFGCATQVAPD